MILMQALVFILIKVRKPMLRPVDHSNCWEVSGVRDAQKFFQAIAALVPEATHLFLEGSAADDVVALIQPFVEPAGYAAPAGTIWSWPKEQRFTLRASPELFARLSEAAAHHAEPEICSHLHIYCGSEPLVTWFDAFIDPIQVSRTIARERVEQFCREVGGILSDGA
jgi:hypothetical protein